MLSLRTWRSFRPLMLGVALAGLAGGLAISAQDKYALRVPDGLAFAEFRGYEAWRVVSVSHPAAGDAMSGAEILNVIVANPAMIKAYAEGIPGNGKPFPDGAKAAKIQYTVRKSSEAPFSVAIPDKLKDVAFMAKDSRRFADSGGWGYALFNYDEAGATFSPDGTGAKCGASCHTIARSKDYVFTRFERR